MSEGEARTSTVVHKRQSGGLNRGSTIAQTCRLSPEVTRREANPSQPKYLSPRRIRVCFILNRHGFDRCESVFELRGLPECHGITLTLCFSSVRRGGDL